MNILNVFHVTGILAQNVRVRVGTVLARPTRLAHVGIKKRMSTNTEFGYNPKRYPSDICITREMQKAVNASPWVVTMFRNPQPSSIVSAIQSDTRVFDYLPEDVNNDELFDRLVQSQNIHGPNFRYSNTRLANRIEMYLSKKDGMSSHGVI